MSNKTEQLILLILEKSPRDITSLMKLSYIIDLSAVRKFNKQITDFSYIRYNYGPFDSKIYEVLHGLIQNGTIETESEYSQYGETVLYKLKGSADELSALNNDEKTLAEQIISDLQGYGAKLLTDIAYSTKPMKDIGATLGGQEHMCEQLNLK